MYLKYKDAGGDLSRQTFSKYIRNVFSHVTASVKRFNIERDLAFGLKERDTVNDVNGDKSYDLSLISEWAPSSFFVRKNDTEEINLVSFGEIVNGNPVVNKITFKKNGEWQFHIGSKQINLEELLIDPHFNCTKTSVQNACEIILKLKTCSGKERENCHPDKTKNQNFIEEFWGENNVIRYRSKICKTVVSLISSTSSCRNCQNANSFTSSSLSNNAFKVSTAETG